MSGILSHAMTNNLITMSICAEHDARQKIGDDYTLPDEATRKLRAQLIMEEALESVQALGFRLSLRSTFAIEKATDFTFYPQPPGAADLEKIIDGCCDTIYVCLGTLASCGVPDEPHMAEVCQANLDKFPNGVAIFNASGKFLKPNGWEPPNHHAVKEMAKAVSVKELARIHYGAYLELKKGKPVVVED